MRYIGRWRMQLASRMLEEGVGIGRIASTVGYRSDAAFQRAFKRFVGVTPGRVAQAAVPARQMTQSPPRARHHHSVDHRRRVFEQVPAQLLDLVPEPRSLLEFEIARMAVHGLLEP